MHPQTKTPLSKLDPAKLTAKWVTRGILTMLLLAGFSHTAFTQSRTEEAKKRLDGQSSGGDIGLFLSIVELSLEFMPEFFYFRPIRTDEQPLRYTAHPYTRDAHGYALHGIRDFSDETTRTTLFQANVFTSMPQGTMAMEQYAADLKWHIRAWGVQSRYEYMLETNAPYGIHQFNIDLERKFRFFRTGDAGFFVGVRSVWMGGDTYVGPQAGTNFELYPLDPFSLRFTTSAAVMQYGLVTNQELGIGIHRDQLRFSLSHRWLNIIGVPFRTVSAGIGVYF
jgi:hypothetical protein